LDDPGYIAVTSCKNEEKTIGNCVRSVLHQTIPPLVYIVIDDGSTDETSRILDTFTPRIDSIYLEGGRVRKRGDHLRNLFLIAVKLASGRVSNWRYLLSVDADEILPQDYVENLIKKMGEDPKLGMASGIPIYKTHGGYEKIHRASDRVWNGARLYRRDCWDSIGFIPSIQGWDMWVRLEANRLGWKTKSFDEINFIEKRQWGDTTLKFWVNRGFTRKILGYSWIAHLITCITRINQKPYLTGSLAFFLSFILYRLRQQTHFNPEYYKFAHEYTSNIMKEWLTLSKIKTMFKR